MKVTSPGADGLTYVERDAVEQCEGGIFMKVDFILDRSSITKFAMSKGFPPWNFIEALTNDKPLAQVHLQALDEYMSGLKGSTKKVWDDIRKNSPKYNK